MKNRVKEIPDIGSLERILDTLPIKDEEHKKEIVCSLIGHSRIMSNFMGYHDCGRCGARLGDTLASIFPAATIAVLIGHNCDKCKENFKDCTWKDTYLVEDPFYHAK